MQTNSLSRKRRKYLAKRNFITYYLQDYYLSKEYSNIFYSNNIVTSHMPFLQKIYDAYENDYNDNPQKYNSNPNNYRIKCAKHIVKILENMLIRTKQRNKEIDKLI